MRINEYQTMALTTASEDGITPAPTWLANGIFGLCGEVGECADIVKKHLFQGHALDEEKLKDELGDVCWYLALCCSAVGLTLEEVMQHNVDKLKARYPKGFDAYRSVHREEMVEDC